MKKTSEHSVWDGIDRSITPPLFISPNPDHSPSPRISLVIDFSDRTATLRAWENVPEDMMFYLLDCLQQRDDAKVRVTRDKVREINNWLVSKLEEMKKHGMLWRDGEEWVFEG